MGVALRNASTGAYLLAARKSGDGASYEALGFDNAQLSAAGVLDGTTPLVLDLIDNAHGGWGWVGMDNVTITGVVPEPASLAMALAAVRSCCAAAAVSDRSAVFDAGAATSRLSALGEAARRDKIDSASWTVTAH